MTIPVLVPPTQAELAVPYVTAATFQAFPTWLDLDNLIPGGVAALQAEQVADAMLAASDWAIGEVENMPLHAHWVQNENQIVRSGNGGKVNLRPRHIPVRAVTALSWGCDPSMMTADTLPDSSMWIEDGRMVSFRPGGGLTTFRGPAIQFGPAARPEVPVYVTWSYEAGFPNAVLSAVSNSGAASVTVTDPAGILPGDVLRIYDPGTTSATAAANEAITVSGTYAPAIPTIPPTATSIPLASGTTTQFTHNPGVQITGFPRRIMQSVIAYGVSLLMREDVSAEEPVSAFGPAARTTAGQRGGQAAGLVNDASGWLARYAPTLRS